MRKIKNSPLSPKINRQRLERKCCCHAVSLANRAYCNGQKTISALERIAIYRDTNDIRWLGLRRMAITHCKLNRCSWTMMPNISVKLAQDLKVNMCWKLISFSDEFTPFWICRSTSDSIPLRYIDSSGPARATSNRSRWFHSGHWKQRNRIRMWSDRRQTGRHGESLFSAQTMEMC